MGEGRAVMQLLLQRFLRGVVLQPSMALRACLLLAAVLAYGTTGFLYFELPGNPELSWSDALWYCLVTLTTVGYGDYFPKTAGGRYLVGVPLLMLGVGLLGFMLSVVATTLISARNKEAKGMNPARTAAQVVVIHYPGTEKLLRLIDELTRDPAIGADARFVLVDPELDELPEALARRHVHYVRGDPTRDATLQRARIGDAAHALVLLRAGGGAAADAVNVAVTLAIEARTKHVNTVVECQDPGTQELLRKAGCDRIVCAGRFDALYMSQELLNPGVQDIVADLLSTAEGQQLYLTPVSGAAGARWAALQRAAARQGHVALGLQRSGANHLNPAADFVLADGDLVVTVGAARIQSLDAGAA
ncbi:MAG: potassium channel family protein [Rubrivivax sp.]